LPTPAFAIPATAPKPTLPQLLRLPTSPRPAPPRLSFPALTQVYKFDEDTAERVTAYASFGGLLMALSGSYRHISGVTVGEQVYLLVRVAA